MKQLAVVKLDNFVTRFTTYYALFLNSRKVLRTPLNLK